MNSLIFIFLLVLSTASLHAGDELMIDNQYGSCFTPPDSDSEDEAIIPITALQKGPLTSVLIGYQDGVIVHRTRKSREVLNQLTGHTGPILCLQTSPHDDNTIISGSADTTVRLWNLAEETNIPFPKHTSPVTAVCFHPKIPHIYASASETGEILITNIKTNGYMHITAHTQKVTGLLFYPDVPYHLISASADQSVKIWDIATNTCVKTLQCQSPVNALSIYENKALKTLHLLIGLADGTIIVLERTNTYKWYLKKRLKQDSVVSLYHLNESHFLSLTTSGIIAKWDIDAGKVVPLLPEDPVNKPIFFSIMPTHPVTLFTVLNDSSFETKYITLRE